MMEYRFIIRAFSVAGLLMLAAGCDSASPKLASVRGKVSFKGVPLPKGAIVFSPDANLGGSGPLASAEIQADGSYSLRSGEEAGARVGWHRITVVAVEEPAQEPDGRRFRVPRSLLPDKYRDPALSGLSREVKPGMDNVIDFDLE